jgi:hypothetical protein
MSPEEDAEFRAKLQDAESELLAKFRTDLCPHGNRKWDDNGRRLACPECKAEAADKVGRYLEADSETLMPRDGDLPQS